MHFSVPYRMAGSETMLHAMMVALAEAGHQTTVVTSDMTNAPPQWEWGPVKGISARNIQHGEEITLASKPDVVISHHQNSVPTVRIAKGIGAKSVFVQHNDFPDNSNVLLENPDLVVFNTHWIARDWSKHAHKWCVVHPPVWAKEHATTPGDMVTLVNLNRDKGAHIFYQLARRFPKYRFLGVTGSHGDQIIPGSRHLPPNVEIIPQTTNMKKDVWSRTKVLLMPSVYESYGMAGVEALASGIPVLAAPTDGLKASLGLAGTFITRNQIAGCVYHLRSLLESPDNWTAAHHRCLSRSAALSPKPELAGFVKMVEDL